MMRTLLQRAALVSGATLGMAFMPATARAQKALVYCPVSVDATGCNAIVNALTGPAYPLGVDRGYDGTGGTVDLNVVDLFTYSVVVVPSLADGAESQPYAMLRDPEVAEHLKAALIGRIAMWSGSPDQGATNRGMKDALIQNLAGWAGGAFGAAKGPGLVTLLDASSGVVSRYDWVRAITPVPVTSDATLLLYNGVRALNQRATTILTSGAGPIVYDNMATFGFQVPNGAPGVSLDAVGQTGTTHGGQVVLLTMEAGNAGGAVVRTDKDDYLPGQTVTTTGSGWEPGEQIKLMLHMDPLRDSDTELTATADAAGNFTNTDFSPADYDIGVRFVLTALGETSGRRAQTTFTDGKATITGTVRSSTLGNPPIPGATVTCLIVDGCNQNETATTNSSGVYTFEINFPNNTASPIIRASATGFTSGAAAVTASNGNTTTQDFTLTPAVVAPTASNDSYSTNEDQTLTVPAPGVLANDLGTGPLSAAIVSTPPVAQGVVSLSANGGFTFTPAADFNGSTSFTYRAQNAGGFSAPATVTITVNSVNDAPTFTLLASHTSNEDAGAQTVANALTGKSAGPANENTQTLTPSISNDNNALFSVQPAIDASGTLTYTAAVDASGTATVSVTLTDNGGTANGGVDETTHTILITVNEVNDAPIFTAGANQTVNEDAGPQTASGWATGISAGPSNESAQTLTFSVTANSNPALFLTAPAVASNGTLTYTTAPNANGTATIKLRLADNGGTANGGVDTSAEQTFTITVNAVNDAPTFTKGEDKTVFEDAGVQTFPGWATAVSAGPADEEGQALTFNVTGNTNSALFAVAPAVDPATGTLTFTPAVNAYGSATIMLTLSDNGGGSDTSTPQMFTITITPVNDVPSFTKGADQTVNEDSGPQTVATWATGISAGPNEAGQAVDFLVSSNNAALFSVQPAIAPNGQLTYTPALNANGTATVTVRIHDDGGTANGGVDTSAPQTFMISVTSVNDAPSFTKGADQTVLEDAAAQSISGWATGSSAGPADESTQTVSFEVTGNTNPSLFAVAPAVDPTGKLTYTVAADANGTASISLRIKDSGGTDNGGVDTSPTETFVINVTPVNDAPVITAFSGPLVPNAVNASINMTGSFKDVDLGDVGSTESHTATIDWGDGTTSSATIATAGPIVRSVAASHVYTSANVYTVKLTVTDAGNLTAYEIFMYVVVYDPNAGFVTGGGWIMSPVGAYAANPSLTGKATFGFVSKYKKGQSAPDGNTEFQFHAAGMNFKSNAYEWLVVAGTKAQFKGTGTIGGAGNYGFLLTAVDGGADKFRIKIWDIETGTAVYDNQMSLPDDGTPTTVLGGGSINIQAK